MSGFFFDATADGHYVTVQRLDWGSALVVWDTFDKNGQAAWIYSIGTVDGNHVHAQGAQNLGGVLQAGGAPTGSHGMVWGNIDIDLTDCFNATFRYDSPLPNFGSGQFPLNRLAFLGDLLQQLKKQDAFQSRNAGFAPAFRFVSPEMAGASTACEQLVLKPCNDRYFCGKRTRSAG